MKTIYYWCPYISKVATVRAVIKSAEAIKKFSNNEFDPIIINVAGEWEAFKQDNKFQIKIIDLTKSKILNNNNWTGFYKSRFIYIYLFFISFLPLLRLLKKSKPDYLIIHLISSLPLFLNLIFNFKTKLILRISGIPKLNHFRNLFWKLSFKKLSNITTPTKGTYNDLVKKNFIKEKIVILYDPIITPSEILEKKKFDVSNLSNYYISVGRLTNQKNFKFLIKNMSSLIKSDKEIKLYIFGDGEQNNELSRLILDLNLENNIKLFPFKQNIYNYIYNSKGFILSSLWEDPGFVLVEAAYLNVPILSSNCKNGPEEILNYGENGILFDSDNSNSFIKNFNIFHKLDEQKKKKFKIKAKKYIKRFTIFSHYVQLKKILN